MHGMPGVGPGPDGRLPPHLRKDMPWWAKPSGFFWLLGLIGLAVALGLYPVVRRLTQRLEGLQRGVQRWGEGDLSVRVPVQGDDEVADLGMPIVSDKDRTLLGAAYLRDRLVVHAFDERFARDFEKVSQKLIQEWSKKAGPDGEKIVNGMK